MANETKSLNKKQRRILLAAGIALLVGIVSLAVSFSSGNLPATVKDGPIPTYTGHLRADQFKHPHPDEDVTTDAAYMELDRRIHTRRGAETVPVETAEDARLEGEAIAFFARYFEIVTAGDASAYNSLFTDTYYKRVLPYERFAPQKIYNIILEEVERTEDIAGDSFVYYVSYAIHENDGTFRRDIPSDAVRTLVFSLVPENGTLKIDAIGY
jgi:hypothetical protein